MIYGYVHDEKSRRRAVVSAIGKVRFSAIKIGSGFKASKKRRTKRGVDYKHNF